MKGDEGLLQFCRDLLRQGYFIRVMQDKAGNHTAQFPREEFSRWKVAWFEDWLPHSSDLNFIEKAWDWCRKYLQDRNFHVDSREELEVGWNEAWEALPQEKIDQWFEAMPGIL